MDLSVQLIMQVFVLMPVAILGSTFFLSISVF